MAWRCNYKTTRKHCPLSFFPIVSANLRGNKVVEKHSFPFPLFPLLQKRGQRAYSGDIHPAIICLFLRETNVYHQMIAPATTLLKIWHLPTTSYQHLLTSFSVTLQKLVPDTDHSQGRHGVGVATC